MARKPKRAEADAAPEGEAAPKKPGLAKKKLILAAGALAVLAGGGAGGYFFLMKGGDHEAAKQAAKKAVAFVDLKEMTINLAQTAGIERQNVMKMKVTLEVADPKAVPEIQPLVPRIEDAFQVYMRELRAGELEGSAAVYRLKEELLKRVNVAVYPAKVDAVLFKELLVQ